MASHANIRNIQLQTVIYVGLCQGGMLVLIYLGNRWKKHSDWREVFS